MMKKLCVIIFMIISSLALFSFTADQRIDVTVSNHPIILNDVLLNYTPDNLSLENRTYVPLREFCEAVGISVEWVEKNGEIILRDKKSDEMSVSADTVLDVYTTYIDQEIAGTENAEDQSELKNFFSEMLTLSNDIIQTEDAAIAMAIAAMNSTATMQYDENHELIALYDENSDLWIVTEKEIIIEESDFDKNEILEVHWAPFVLLKRTGEIVLVCMV